ncbi:MAG: hypothetical protein RR595_00545 [Lysinibacillus sp.]
MGANDSDYKTLMVSQLNEFGSANTDEIIYTKIAIARATLSERIREVEKELDKLNDKGMKIKEEILNTDNASVKADWQTMLEKNVIQREGVERTLYLLKSNKLDKLEKVTKETKQKILELTKEELTEGQKLEQLDFVVVYDERVIIHFDLVSYQFIIDELNGYLRENEKIYDTFEKSNAEHELFRTPKDAREFYESQQE